MRYAIPMLSHIFRTVLPAQFTICVTLFAVMNSKSYRAFEGKKLKFIRNLKEQTQKFRSTYLRREFIADE